MLIVLGIAALVVIAYSIAWAVWYRVPATPAEIVDLRVDRSQKPYYISFCAALAANPHGFPGHCYIAWTDKPALNLLDQESAGYVPRFSKDQVPSLWRNVSGAVCRQAAIGNTRNLDVLTAIVNRTDYDRAKELCDSWDTKSFKVGRRDCVTFADCIARSINLRTPEREYKFPQDYVSDLKRLNGDRGSVGNSRVTTTCGSDPRRS
jgi:hypothetical protein